MLIIIKNKLTIARLSIAGYSIVSLLAALVLEFGFGYLPCRLCIFQRYYLLVALIFVLVDFILPKYRIIWLARLAIMGGAIVALYQFFQQYGFIKSGVCSIADLMKGISCSDKKPVFLGLSLAGWNIILSLLVLVLSFKPWKIRKS